MHHMQVKSLATKHAEVYIERGEDEVRQLLAIDELTDEDAEAVIKQIKENLVAALKKPTVKEEKKEVVVDRSHIKLPAGFECYDLYNVQREIVTDENGNSVWNGGFVQIGKPVRTEIKLEPWRAEMFNEQSHNSNQRLYKVDL